MVESIEYRVSDYIVSDYYREVVYRWYADSVQVVKPYSHRGRRLVYSIRLYSIQLLYIIYVCMAYLVSADHLDVAPEVGYNVGCRM
jgi:hypothetical protein